jgi:hypothetical protein
VFEGSPATVHRVDVDVVLPKLLPNPFENFRVVAVVGEHHSKVKCRQPFAVRFVDCGRIVLKDRSDTWHGPSSHCQHQSVATRCAVLRQAVHLNKRASGGRE